MEIIIGESKKQGSKMDATATGSESDRPVDFVRAIVREDVNANKNEGRVATRFPPEPNGYLHIGHAKAICIDFGIALEFGGTCNLRFDDTNPAKEDVEYVEAIQEDVRWLGFNWDDRLYYASNYFDRMYEYAVELIKLGKAYVDSLSAEEIRTHRGTLTEAGKESPYRNRTIEENIDLFERMRAGEFEDGTHILRAKIDMASPNMNMRDPALYRIRRAVHHRTGNKWIIYPMYDFAHSLSDSLEGITHSICTLEFEDHRPLYDWCQEALQVPHRSRQIEFARLNLNYTVVSKRKLLQLVQRGLVNGWDDPRMPTLCGLRRRGYTPEAIRNFCERVGVAKRDGVIDIALLEHALREDLNARAQRRMGVLNPVKLIIDNYPEEKTEEVNAVNNPEDASAGTRKVAFSRELYIEREDFMEDPPKKFFRLSPGRAVRLRYAYLVTCTGVTKNEAGEIIEIHCEYDPESLAEDYTGGPKAKATLHWVSANNAVKAKIRLYDRLFFVENPNDEKDGREFTDYLNPESLKILLDCRVEADLSGVTAGSCYQFERMGYFCADPDSTPETPVFNRTVTLRDAWAKIAKQAC